MAEVLLFHRVQGLTDGVRGFADDLRAGRPHGARRPTSSTAGPSARSRRVAHLKGVDGVARPRAVVEDLPRRWSTPGFS